MAKPTMSSSDEKGFQYKSVAKSLQSDSDLSLATITTSIKNEFESFTDDDMNHHIEEIEIWNCTVNFDSETNAVETKNKK